MRISRMTRAAAVLAMAAACSSGPAFPESIAFERQTLTKATSWVRDGMAGAVYVPPGEKLPQASLQVGAIISNDHLTAEALHGWIRGQLQGVMHFHTDDRPDHSCRVSQTPDRMYIALEVCKTGVARSVCVEADEAIDLDAIASCIGRSDYRCFGDVCDARWVARREALDLFVANTLTIR